jgi:hypothetical protein
MKEQQRAVYRSMQGKEVDMTKLINQNEMTVAVGNVKVNARGDELGPGGRIVRKREDVLAEYYQDHPDTVPDETFKKQQVAKPVVSAPAVEEAPVAKEKAEKPEKE